MKVVLIRSYSTNHDSAITRPAVLHNGRYYAIGDISTKGAMHMMRYEITHRLSAKQYTFLDKDSYVQPGYTLPATRATVVRMLGDLPKSFASILDDKIAKYNRAGLPVREIA